MILPNAGYLNSAVPARKYSVAVAAVPHKRFELTARQREVINEAIDLFSLVAFLWAICLVRA